jgi:hypothetical protein
MKRETKMPKLDSIDPKIKNRYAGEKPTLQGSDIREDQSKPEKMSSVFSTIAKITAAFGVVGGLALHFIGHVTHEIHLGALGVEPGLFPKPIDWIEIQGFYTIYERFSVIGSLLADHKLHLLLLWISLIGYFLIVLQISKIPRSERLKSWGIRIRSWPRVLGISIWLACATTFVLPITIFFISSTMAMLTIFGETGGIALANRDIATFQKGCDKALLGQKCFDLMKDGKLIARGFLIESSATHIAMFDINAKRARALERAGTEIIADSPTALVVIKSK